MGTFGVRVSNAYSFEDFEEDLRTVMKRAGCQNEEICFIFNELAVLGPAMIERMNALLASGEVPGLFEGEEYTALMTECRAAAQRDGVLVDSEEELYKRFATTVQRKLHIVFTMNPADQSAKSGGGSSPALFNRCVTDWYGRRWPAAAMLQVAAELTDKLEVTNGAPAITYTPVPEEEKIARFFTSEQHAKCVRCLHDVHEVVETEAATLSARAHKRIIVTPRSYLDLIHHMATVFEEKQSSLQNKQSHLNTGIKKLEDTEKEVALMQQQLKTKQKELETQIWTQLP